MTKITNVSQLEEEEAIVKERVRSEQEKGCLREKSIKNQSEDRYVKECTKRKDIKNVNERLLERRVTHLLLDQIH